MIEKSSKRRVSIITEIILFLVVLTVVVAVFKHYYNSQNLLNDVIYEFASENLLVEQRDTKAVEAENKMYIKNIKEEYGIKIKFGEDIEEFAKAVDSLPQYDMNILNNNLKIIYKALEKYPKTVFDISKSKKYPITIFILEKFNNNNVALAARTSLNDFRLYISNTQKFERAFHHEMYHLLEYYMEDTKKNLYLSWNDLNPENFEYESNVTKLTDEYVYKESQKNLKDSDSLIQDNLDKEENIKNNELNPYFVTKYSKSTEKEDRAEIFAEIMILSKKPKYLYEGQNIRKKAEVMKKTINQNVTNEDFSYSKYFE